MSKPSKIHDPNGYKRHEDAEFFYTLCWIGAIIIGCLVLIARLFG